MIRPTKQVIIMRKDLNMRKGKMVAQGSHASLGAVLEMMGNVSIDYSDALKTWLDNSYRKICVSVDSEADLIALWIKAKGCNLPTALITDNGATEFHGVPTKTCMAIGPYWAEEIDKITEDLKLL